MTARTPADPAAAPGPVETHGPRGPVRPTGRSRRRLTIGLLAAAGVAGVVAGAALLYGFLPHPVVAGDPKASGLDVPDDRAGSRPVKVVRPRRDPNFRITTRQFATVEPYYMAGLRARVAGEVRVVSRNIGDRVHAGDLLVEIDAPDLRQAVEQKAAVIAQREREVAAAEAELKVADAAAAAARVAVREKAVGVARARDLRDARKTDLEQVSELFSRSSVVKARVDAARLDFFAAERAIEAAEAEVERAKVDVTGKAASREKAAADVELKRTLVAVARADRDAAAIQLGYTQLHAPFDGVVVARTADPGKFVGGGGDPLVTVARTDLVTVVVKLPDNAAPFVTPTTRATVEFSQLPGVTASGPITRYSPYIDPADQTMRVEVDVYNGSLADYRAAQAAAAAGPGLAPLAPLDRLAVLAGTRGRLAAREGWREGDALVPEWGPGDTGFRQLVPGMTATVRLDLKNFADTYMLPSGAVYGRAGQFYILVVENGVTRSVPVAVQANDGTLAKVALVVQAGGRVVTRELTGNELIVAARQLEVGEGTRVTPVVEDW